MVAKVRLVSIGYSTAFDDCTIKPYVWGEFFDKKEAIEKVRQIACQLTEEQEELLTNQGCASAGSTTHRQYYFILYPDEQKQWIKTLVRELL